MEEKRITILVAPLDWGLGHATRCIPLIQHFIQLGCKIIIATEGIQEKLLKTEFPSLEFVHLPGYRIGYSSKKRFFLLKIILQLPKILTRIGQEHKWLKYYLKTSKVSAIISDNRYGLHHSSVPSVFITHQLTIKAPFVLAEKIIHRINYRLIQKFTTCWIPDQQGSGNLGGALSHPAFLPAIPVNYIGGLSRLKAGRLIPKEYDILVIISGPEPQRTLLERKLFKELEGFSGKALLIRGLPGSVDTLKTTDRLTVVNHLSARDLSNAFDASELIISRSGYTTVMDICKLKKKSILIPTPGQTEQEYLAQHLQEQRWCLTANQANFSLPDMLRKAEKFDFALPDMDMDVYKTVLEAFVDKLRQ